MKIKGEFIVREIIGECVLVPVGETALRFNGIISLNPVSAVIWKGLLENKDREQLLEDILEEFEVERDQAAADLDEFLQLLRQNQLLD